MGVSPRTGDAHKGLCYKDLGAFLQFCPNAPYWIALVNEDLHETYVKYPFLAYGTDWLAFGHLVIAVAFLGPLRDPMRNVWVLTFGMIACVGVIPLALIAGRLRGIPFCWQLIDCCFGVFGLIVVNASCMGGRESLARVFLAKGATRYVGPVDYPEGADSLMYELELLYHYLCRGRPIEEAHAVACGADDDRRMFRLCAPD